MEFIEELSATWGSGQGGTEWEGRIPGSVSRSMHK